MVEKGSVGNLKLTFTDYGKGFDWMDPAQAEGPLFLRKATDIKNVWIPYGE